MAVGLVYVARRLKVRGEGGGAWSALGPLKSPAPFSHLTNGWGGVLTLNLNLFSTPHTEMDSNTIQHLLLEAI